MRSLFKKVLRIFKAIRLVNAAVDLLFSALFDVG